MGGAGGQCALLPLAFGPQKPETAPFSPGAWSVFLFFFPSLASVRVSNPSRPQSIAFFLCTGLFFVGVFVPAGGGTWSKWEGRLNIPNGPSADVDVSFGLTKAKAKGAGSITYGSSEAGNLFPGSQGFGDRDKLKSGGLLVSSLLGFTTIFAVASIASVALALSGKLQKVTRFTYLFLLLWVGTALGPVLVWPSMGANQVVDTAHALNKYSDSDLSARRYGWCYALYVAFGFVCGTIAAVCGGVLYAKRDSAGMAADGTPTHQPFVNPTAEEGSEGAYRGWADDV